MKKILSDIIERSMHNNLYLALLFRIIVIATT